MAVDLIGTRAKSKKKMDEKDCKKTRHFSFLKPEAKKTFLKDTGNFKQIKNGSNKIVCFRCDKNYLAPSCSLRRNIKCLECGGFNYLNKVYKKKG